MNKKATVNLIKKIAEDLDWYPGDAPSAKPKPSGGSRSTPVGGGEIGDFDAPTTQPTETGGGSSGVPQVKKMQQALINLAQSVTAQVNVQGMGSDRPQEQGEAAQRDSFNNFLTKHFMRGADVQGQEFDPNSKEKNPSQANRMTSIMDTMGRIGDSKTRSMVADGKWGPLTNNGLRNAYAFASAMLQLASSFKTPPQAYNQADLAEFKEYIPPDEYVTPVIKIDANAIQHAEYITQHLNGIQKMYGEIKSDILQNPQYQTYIEGNTPFVTYKKTGPAFNQQEKQMYDQMSYGNPQYNRTFNFSVRSPDGKASMEGHISIADLMSSDAFKKWYYSPNNAVREDPSLIFSAIRQSLQQAGQGGA